MEFKAGQKRQIDAFLTNPDPETRIVLLFGPDEGLVRERAERLCDAIVPDRHDPFGRVELGAGDLDRDPARLADEAAALSFTGGRRVVRVRGVGNDLAGRVKDVLAGPVGGGLVVLEAGDLKKGALRTVCAGKDQRAVAIPCYQEDDRDVGAMVRETLEGDGLTIDPDALAYLVGHLGSDRGVTRAELEKLALYVDRDAEQRGRVTLADAEACVGDSAALSLDALAYAVLGGDLETLERLFDRVLGEGTAPVSVIRALQRHVHRLQIGVGMVASGTPAGQVPKAMRPPIFWRDEAAFARALQAWARTPERLDTALARLTEAELGCKRTGVPDRPVCARALMDLALAARAGDRGRARG